MRLPLRPWFLVGSIPTPLPTLASAPSRAPRRWLLCALPIAGLALAIWLGSPTVRVPDDGARGGEANSASARSPRGVEDSEPRGGAPAGEASALRRQAADPSHLLGIAGRLLQDGRPLAGASVRTDDEEERSSCKSAVDGTFLLQPRVGNGQFLEVVGPTVPPGFHFGPVDLTEGQRFEFGDVTVPRPAAITGRVLDAAGRPLAGMTVFAAGVGDNVLPFQPEAASSGPSAHTGSDGRFVLDGLRPGAIRLYIDHPDHILRDGGEDVQAEAGPGERVDVGDLVPPLAEALHGFVFDEPGQPVAGALLMPGGCECGHRHPTRAVRSGADGSFELRGFGRHEDLLVQAEGFAARYCSEVDLAPRPFVVRLQPSPALSGRVQGNRGLPGYLRVVAADGYRSEIPSEVRRLLGGPHTIGGDGSFHVAGLPPGRWLLTARVPGVGSIINVVCELPLQGPLSLTLEPAREVAVQVVDDRGDPLGGAEVWQCNFEDEWELAAASMVRPDEITRTGADGRATLRLWSRRQHWVTGWAPQHGNDSTVVDFATAPQTLKLVLVSEAGQVTGEVLAPGLPADVPLGARIQRLGVPDAQPWDVAVDARGRFATGALRGGRYSLCAVAGELSSRARYRQSAARSVQALTGAVARGKEEQVEVTAGAVLEVRLEAPPVGELSGRVLAHGRPVPGAIVFARPGRGEPEPNLLPVQLCASEGRVFTAADAEGRFRFLATATGSFQLRARHARGASWSAPVVARIDSRGERATCDLQLDGASIGGSFDVGVLPPAERSTLRASLYHLEDAAADPRHSVWTAEDSLRQLSDTVQTLQPDRSGAFAFECLPPGDWLLRLADRRGILLQRAVQLATDEVVELGPVQLADGIAPQLRCGLGEHSGVLLLQRVDGRELFLRVVDNCGVDGFAWGTLVPGEYRLRAMKMRLLTLSHAARTYTSWHPDETYGDPVDLVLHADGTCTPPVVWPDGLVR